jgi:uncharacterized membrane protein
MFVALRPPNHKGWQVRIISGALCGTVWLLLVAPACAGTVIQTENAKPGTTDWQITNPATNREIEGYASLTSVPRGGQISFFVNTTDPVFQIEIFRMGWYGGLGGRRMTQPVQLAGTRQVIPQPDPTTGLVECNWINPYVFTIPNNTSDPSDWASGVYLAKLTGLTSGKQRYIIFVVRDDVRPSNYFFQSSVNTYQAYNNWGGKSLYSFNSTNGQAQKVSFNRPYDRSDTGITAGTYGVADGSGEFLHSWEYNMVRFLEREGYDVAYCTDVDTHENPNLILSHKVFLVVGHDEYWSWQMRSNVIAARDRGVSLAFFSGNTMFWQIRYEPSTVNAAPDHTIVAYKELATTLDPLYLDGNPSNDYLVTVQWRQAPVSLPEDAIIGVMYGSGPVQGDLVVVNAAHPAFANTGLQNGSVLPGLLGYEVDRMFGNAPASTQLLMHSQYLDSGGLTFFSDMTIYTAASGATVFAAGTIQWVWGLDDYNAPALRPSWLNPAMQQVTRNLLAILIGDMPPVANPGGPYAGNPKIAVQFNGGGSSDPDGTVAAYEWDFGDGSTSTGVAPTHTYTATDKYTVRLIVTDDKGSRNAASTTATIADFSLSAAASQLIVQQGTAGTDLITVTPANGFNGTVTFSISGVPAASTASFSPGSVSGSGSTTLTLKVGATHTICYPLTITGTSGSLQHSIGVSLCSGQPGSSPDFSLGTWPLLPSVSAGSSTSTTVYVTSIGGFSGTVSLTASGLPSSANANFSPGATVVGEGSPTITISTSTSTPLGTYTVTITGTSGSLQHSTPVTLTVNPPAATPDFSISASPSSQTVNPGSSAAYTVTIGALNGFSGTVSFGVTGLPGGAGASFSPTTVNTSGSSTMTVTTAANLPPGSYPVTITGTSGSLQHSAGVTLNLSDFTLGASPASQSVNPGSSTTYTVGITALGGFGGVVSFSTSGLPSGASASFTPTTVTGGGSTTMTVATAANTPPGNYPVTITGTSVTQQHSAQVSLTVNGPAPDFSLSASPAQLIVQQGSSGNYTINVSPINGFTGTVTFTLTGLPGSGTTASFNPTSVTGTGSTTLTVNVGATLHPICYPMTITGTSGSLQHAASVSLCSARAGTSPDFSLGTWPMLPTVSAGTSASTTVYVTSIGGFTGPVSLSVSGLPSGASASLSATTINGEGTAILTITTSTSTPQATYTVTVTGTSGSLLRTTPATLTVGP